MLCPVNPTVKDTFQPIPDFNGCAMSHLPQAHVDTSHSHLVSKLKLQTIKTWVELGNVAKGNHKSGRYTHYCAMSFLSREETLEITYRGLLAEPSARSCSSMETSTDTLC